MSIRPILIAGPTASGKSALAVGLARALGGVVINADSMQVYAELRILTARPTDEELAQAPHALYGHVAASRAYSTGQWLADVRVALTEANAEGRVPIIVGGTGLYFKALLEGLSPIPAIPGDVRAHWRGEAGRLGAKALHHVLCERDPVMAARLLPSDPQRIVRALEVLEATGRSLAEWQAVPGVPLLAPEAVHKFVLMPDRAGLYERCDARFDAMMRDGALDEVRALAELRLSPELPILGALGVRPLVQHLGGARTFEDAVADGKRETRQYIKRQRTWLKRNMIAWIINQTLFNGEIIDYTAFIIRNEH